MRKDFGLDCEIYFNDTTIFELEQQVHQPFRFTSRISHLTSHFNNQAIITSIFCANKFCLSFSGMPSSVITR